MSYHSNNVYNHYQESTVTLASSEGLIVLLYAEFLCCLVVAKEAFMANDRLTKNKNVTKSVEILVELIQSLNMEKGGEVALSLAFLYKYIAQQLLLLHSNPTLELFDETIKLITPLKEAWETIAMPSTVVSTPKPLL